jgi:Arc/MetJ-type ribon-helix-helix transcriptional regulator
VDKPIVREALRLLLDEREAARIKAEKECDSCRTDQVEMHRRWSLADATVGETKSRALDADRKLRESEAHLDEARIAYAVVRGALQAAEKE